MWNGECEMWKEWMQAFGESASGEASYKRPLKMANGEKDNVEWRMANVECEGQFGIWDWGLKR
jgi:hypothetical protein